MRSEARSREISATGAVWGKMTTRVNPKEGLSLQFEPPRRLSESSLFHFIRAFYDRLGQQAWSHHALPTHVTSHAGMARSYAELIAAWLEDLHAAGRLDRNA